MQTHVQGSGFSLCRWTAYPIKTGEPVYKAPPMEGKSKKWSGDFCDPAAVISYIKSIATAPEYRDAAISEFASTLQFTGPKEVQIIESTLSPVTSLAVFKQGGVNTHDQYFAEYNHAEQIANIVQVIPALIPTPPAHPKSGFRCYEFSENEGKPFDAPAFPSNFVQCLDYMFETVGSPNVAITRGVSGGTGPQRKLKSFSLWSTTALPPGGSSNVLARQQFGADVEGAAVILARNALVFTKNKIPFERKVKKSKGELKKVSLKKKLGAGAVTKKARKAKIDE